MYIFKFLLHFVLVSVASAANNASVIQHTYRSCTFVNNDTCGYKVESPWSIHQGPFQLMGQTLINGGKDDDFYAFFEPPSAIGSPLFSMTSPLLPGGAACLSFYYTLPAATATLHVRMRTEDNTTKELLNVTDHMIRDWKRVEGLFVQHNGAFWVEFVAKTTISALVGVDNITVERFTCQAGYRPVKTKVEAYCANSHNTLPSCESIESASNNTGSCTFANNDTCGYTIDGNWTIHEGPYLFLNHKLLNNGTDDDCYALFEPPHSSGNPLFSMTSPLLPVGAACLSFYYTLPASTATLYVTRTENNVTVELWNVTNRGIRNWTRVELLVVKNTEQGMVGFTARSAHNAFVGVDNITIESFTCSKGFQLITADVEPFCAGRSNTQPKCQLIELYCGTFSDPPNGYVLTSGTTVGSTATVTCQIGYELDGSKYSTCGTNGKWTASGQTCTLVDCHKFPVPPNGNVSASSTTYGSATTITCHTGYNINGNSISTCGSNGKWSSTGQKCIPIDCGHLNPPANGTVLLTATTFGSTATISCLTGYNLHGSRTSTCCINGNWNSTGQICTIVDCGHLNSPQHGHVSHTATTYGSTATISCHTGYKLNGSRTATCASNGQWDSNGQICTVVDCGVLNPPTNGSVTVTDTTFGSTVTITCNTGYNLKGSNTSTCDNNGHWSNNGQLCTLEVCSLFTKPDNGIVEITGTTFGSTATITCNTGYILNGKNYSTCNSNGNWSNIGQSCTLVDCGHLNPPANGTVSLTATTYGSLATISCHIGYNLHGSSTATCDSNGNWNSAGQICTIVDCGPLYKPTNGSLHLNSTMVGAVALVLCHKGYVLSGSNTSTCGSNGSWSSTGQLCIPEQIDLDQAIRAGCSNIGWNISVDLIMLQQMFPSSSSSDIYFGKTSCRGTLSRNILQYTFGFQDCLTNEKISGEAIIYENKLIFATFDPLNPHIIRNHIWTYTIECDVIRREATSFHIHHDVNTHHSSVVVHNNISLGFYSDPSFTRDIPGNPLHASVGSTIYVKVYTTTSDWSIKMRLHSCYTKPSQNSNTTLDYMLINDGCEVDANTHIMSQSTHETTFMFQDFEYSTNPEGLDIYCNATFCPANDFSSTCLQSCNIST